MSANTSSQKGLCTFVEMRPLTHLHWLRKRAGVRLQRALHVLFAGDFGPERIADFVERLVRLRDLGLCWRHRETVQKIDSCSSYFQVRCEEDEKSRGKDFGGRKDVKSRGKESESGERNLEKFATLDKKAEQPALKEQQRRKQKSSRGARQTGHLRAEKRFWRNANVVPRRSDKGVLGRKE